MNYSIILLGATISVSFFLRLISVCGAIEIESAINSRDPYIQYTEHELSELREAYISAGIFSDHDSELEQTIERIRRAKQTLYSSGTEKISKKWHGSQSDLQPLYDDDDFYQEQICGVPPKDFSSCTTCYSSPITEDELAEGCQYTNEEKTVIYCKGEALTRIPRLPSSLHLLEFQNTQIKTVNTTDFVNYTIRNIEFVQNQIQYIEPWAFCNVQDLTYLSIVNNRLEFLAYGIYLGLENVNILLLDGNNISFEIYQNCSAREIDEIPTVLNKLLSFSLSKNPLKIIPEQMWAGLRESSLRIMDLSSCDLEYIHPGALSFLTNLTTLHLSENPKLMFSLESALTGLKNSKLDTLHLANNDLTTFPWAALQQLNKKWKKLNLSFNNFQSLDAYAFPEFLSSLTVLSLSSCGIRQIHDAAFEHLHILEELDLSYNKLYEPPAFRQQSKLKYLTLSYNAPADEVGNTNPTFIIRDYDFEQLPSLQHLALNNNPIKEISQHAFAGLKKLSSLILDDCSISYIADGSFSDLESLSVLHLRNNNIKTLKSEMFTGLSRLTVLSLSKSQVELPSSTDCEESDSPSSSVCKPFSTMQNLRYLDMSSNNIHKLTTGLFSHNANLITLDLSQNAIVTWNSSILPRMEIRDDSSDERQFLISNNEIRSVTATMFEDIVKFGPHIVDMARNPLYCDNSACKLRDHLNGVLEPTIRWQRKEEYQCQDPFSGASYYILEISDKTCEDIDRKLNGPQVGNQLGPEVESTSSMVVWVVLAASAVCLAPITFFAYRKREWLKFLVFKAKLEIGKPSISKRRFKNSEVEETSEYDYDVFVSYHNSNREFIQEKFVPHLESHSLLNTNSTNVESQGDNGLRICLHERDFEAGVPITENIVYAVDRSKKTVIVVSKSYLQSQWCTFEMNLAFHRLVESRRKAFVLILLEEVPTEARTKVLNYLMSSKTYLEWPGDDASPQDVQRFWTRLKKSLLYDS